MATQGFSTGIHQYGNGNNGTNLDPYTYNPRYPGLDESNYKKLADKINALGLTGSDREKSMDEAYRQVLPIVQKDIQMSDRNQYLNQAQYQVSQIQDKNAQQQAKYKLSVEQLAQKVKEVYNLDPTADDQAVFNHRIEGIPNGGELLARYMNDGDRTLLYKGGLEDMLGTPNIPEGSVGGITSIINEQSKVGGKSFGAKVNNVADWLNIVGKGTEGIDNLAQRIPIFTAEGQVENLANKVNNLSEDEMAELYNRYVRMVQNAKNGDIHDRGRAELLWDGLIGGDQRAIDILNTAQLADYSEAMKQDGIERNQWGTQLYDRAKGGEGEWKDEYEESIKNLDESSLPGIITGPAKAGLWTADKAKNLLNFIGGSWGALENYAEGAGVGMQKLDDIRDRRWTIPQDMENNETAFEMFVLDKTANFGEYALDAPDTLMGVKGGPNVGKMLINIPGSFIKTLTGKVRAKTNPLDTKMGLLRMLFTEEGQQAMINRYGTIDAITRTMEQDPVGLASDMIDRADKIHWASSKIPGTSEYTMMGDITDAMSDNIVKGNINLKNDPFMKGNVEIPGIVQGMNNLSNRFNKKGLTSLGSYVNYSNRISQTDPYQLLTDPKKFAYEFGQTAREGVDTFRNLKPDTQDFFLNRANRIKQNTYRMTKGEQEKFADMAGESQGEFMNKRGYKNLDDLGNALIKNLDQVDEAMATMEGRYKSKQLNTVMNEVLKYATDVEDPNLKRWQELYAKNKEGGLEMSEINEVKRYFERKNIFTYLKDNKNKKAELATNRDTALREWQYKIAEEGGLDNLAELNKETQKLKFLVDNAEDWQNGIQGNNTIKLTDWIVASAGGLNAKSIYTLVGKQIYEAPRFKDKMTDVLNYLGGREHEAGPTVDFEKIKQANTARAERQKQEAINRAILAQELAKVKNEQEFQDWLHNAELLTHALPYYEGYNGEPTTTIVTNENGQSIRSGRGEITDTNLQSSDSYLQEGEDGYSLNRNLDTNPDNMTNPNPTRRTWTVNEADNMDRAEMVSKIRELYAEGEGRRIPSEIEDFLIQDVGMDFDEVNSLLTEAINNPSGYTNKSEYDKYFSNRKNEAIDEVNNLKQGEKIHISQENGHGYIITKLDKGFYRVEYDNSSASDLMGIEDVNYLLKQSGDRIDYDFDNVERYSVTEGEGNTPIEEDMGTDENAVDYKGNKVADQEYMTREEYEEGESPYEQELEVTTPGKRPRATRPKAGNDVEFALTDELQRAHRPSDIEYINQDGEWLQGTDDETLIRIAYPDNFEQYDSNSFSDRQNGRMDLLSDSGMMKLSYNDGYVNIDLMYEPTEDQINALRNIGEYDEVKRVQINILDPQAKRTVRINDVNSMDETINYIREYFG